jgi:hypothetical protein
MSASSPARVSSRFSASGSGFRHDGRTPSIRSNCSSTFGSMTWTPGRARDRVPCVRRPGRPSRLLGVRSKRHLTAITVTSAWSRRWDNPDRGPALCRIVACKPLERPGHADSASVAAPYSLKQVREAERGAYVHGVLGIKSDRDRRRRLRPGAYGLRYRGQRRYGRATESTGVPGVHGGLVARLPRHIGPGRVRICVACSSWSRDRSAVSK